MSGSASIVVRPGDLCGITQGSRAKDYQASPYTATAASCHPQRHKYTKTTIQTQSTEIQTYKYTNTQNSLAKVHHTGLLEAQILKAAEILNNKLILCAVTSQHTRQINILE